MVKNVLAVMVAATLMAGTAWAADDYKGTAAGAWSKNGAAASDLTGETIAVTSSSNAGISAASTADTSGTFGAVTADTGTLYIGEVAAGSGGATGKVAATITGNVTLANNATVDIKAGNSLTIGGNFVLNTAGKVKTTATSTLTLNGTGADKLADALYAADNSIAALGNVNLNGAVEDFDLSSAGSLATGTVTIGEQAATVGTINIKAANLVVKGTSGTGKYGAITAKDLTLAAGTTTALGGTLALSGELKSSADSVALIVTDMSLTSSEVTGGFSKHLGTTKIADEVLLTISSNIGKIDNSANDDLSHGLKIDNVTAVADINAILTNVTAGNEAGNIGVVAIDDALAAAGTVGLEGITAGTLILTADQSAVAVAVNAGGADLVLNGGSNFGAITAANVKVAATGATFKKAVDAASLDAAAATTVFSGASATDKATFTGEVAIGSSATVQAGANSTVNITDLDFTASTATLSNTGGDLAVSGTVANLANGALTFAAAGNTTLTGDSAAKLLQKASATTSSIGAVTVDGNAGGAVINLSGANAGSVTFKKAQTFAASETVTFGAATMNLLAGDSVFGDTVAAASINIGGENQTAPVSASFAGHITGAVNVADGNTMIVAGNITGTGNVTAGADATLKIAGANTNKLAVTGDLVLDPTSNLVVDSAITSATAVTAFSGSSAVKVGESTDAAVIEAYLADQNTANLVNVVAFTYDAANKTIKYDITAQTDAAGAMASILEEAGLESMTSGLNESVADAWSDIASGASGVTASNARGNETKKLINDYLGTNAAVTNASTAEMQSVVSTLAGHDAAKSLDVAMLTANNVTGKINGRVAQNNLARAEADAISGNDAFASTILNNSFANRFWFGGFGVWEDADRRGADAGYKYDSYGFITGYDRVFGDLTFGASFAYTAGDYEDKNVLASDSSIDTYAFNLYGTYNHCSGLFATLIAGYAYSDYDMNNRVTVANQWERSKFNVKTWTFGGQLGYDFHPVRNVTITPSVGLYYYTSSSNSFSTTIKNNMKVERDSTEMPVDVTVSYDIPTSSGGNIRLSANGGYAYNFSSDGGELNSFGYNGIAGAQIEGIKGRENSKHSWNVGAGATYSCGRLDLGLKYDFYGKADYKAHRVLGTVGLSF